MNPVIQHLLKEMETGEPDMKPGYLLDIGDYIEHPYPHEDSYPETVQQLVILLSKETEPEVRRQLVKVIERAYSYPVSLSGINFEPLISKLETADPILIQSVLYLLSLTYDRKYIPVIERYINHPQEEVKQEALYILANW